MTRNVLLAATILAVAVPFASRAQTPNGAISGLYVGAGVGWNYLQSEQLNNFSSQGGLLSVPVPNKSVNFGSGLATVLSLGWGFGNGLRAEIEGNYRYNATNQNGSLPIFRSIQTTTGGTENKAGAMVNVLYDFTNAFGPGYTPYVGAGVGWQYVRQSNLQVFGLLPAGPSAGQPYLFRMNSGTNSFAYQAIVGMAFSLASWAPGLDATLEYRFLGTGGDRTYKAQFFAPNVATGTNFKVGSEYSHAIMIGLRYAFNAAPPPLPVPIPVAPAPAPAPSRTYLVFFDWDRADLTDRARQVIAEEAQASTRVQVTRIQVNGYTDLSGTGRYNTRGYTLRYIHVGAAVFAISCIPAYGSNNNGGHTTAMLLSSPCSNVDGSPPASPTANESGLAALTGPRDLATAQSQLRAAGYRAKTYSAPRCRVPTRCHRPVKRRRAPIAIWPFPGGRAAGKSKRGRTSGSRRPTPEVNAGSRRQFKRKPSSMSRISR